ncbi:MAG: beta-phosphoglucomutase family hydrolase [Deltaproteobacteria bacterium]|nr:beta-phosphoglucomutase family hydrolase [Deltaproteobacteria bacterium]MBW2122055.1 beta-phosphoglucomutase family hydrolase [Deltaproteobacteria bacterium]
MGQSEKLGRTITRDRFDAVLFDLDGVLTDTAKVHAACWKKMLDDYLKERAVEKNEPFRPFDIATDYRRYVDGKLRCEGVRSFLESRGIELPYGDPDSPPGRETICGLGNLKDRLVKEVLDSEGVEAYEGSVAFVRHLRSRGFKTAVVSASSNCEAILKAARITELFDVRIDGEVAARLQLAGKPAPDTFLKAADQLHVEPARAVVVEDAISGVQAGRAGGFGLVVGVDRKGDADALRENGAEIVVSDLGEMIP